MYKMSIWFCACATILLQANYYGPPAQFGSDRLHAALAENSLAASKALATRPHVNVHTYNHQDRSTHLNFGADNKAPISISYGNTLSSAAGAAPAQPRESSWLRRLTRWSWGGSEVKQAEDSFFGNKRALTYKALALGYIYLNFRLFRSTAFMQDSERWSLWRPDLPLADLIALPQADAARLLVAEIRERYEHTYKQPAPENPFGLFMKAIETEEATLRTYQTLSTILLKVDDIEHRFLNVCCAYMPRFYGISLSSFVTCLAAKIRVKTLFYLDETLLQLVPERLARLAYLKTIFSDWLASHKMQVARRMLSKGRARLAYPKLALPA